VGAGNVMHGRREGLQAQKCEVRSLKSETDYSFLFFLETFALFALNERQSSFDQACSGYNRDMHAPAFLDNW
jgi:hypothetical protein